MLCRPGLVYDHARALKEYCKDFAVGLKVFDVFNTKQMHDSVIMGIENASKNWNFIISMFPMSYDIYFVFGYGCFMCICMISNFFGTRSGFFGEDRLATLSTAMICFVQKYNWLGCNVGFHVFRNRQCNLKVQVYNVRKLYFQANFCKVGYFPKTKSSTVVKT